MANQEPKPVKKKDAFWDDETEKIETRVAELEADPTVTNIVGPVIHNSQLEKVQITYDQLVEEDD